MLIEDTKPVVSMVLMVFGYVLAKKDIKANILRADWKPIISLFGEVYAGF